jgi:hypothetical protein
VAVVLADGTVRSDWSDTLFADIDKLSVVSLSPGQRVEGQIAVVGDDLDIASVEMAELFGLQETITAEVSQTHEERDPGPARAPVSGALPRVRGGARLRLRCVVVCCGPLTWADVRSTRAEAAWSTG